jgi:hypothetical protein
MRTRIVLVSAMLVLSFIQAMAIYAQEQNPIVGIWKMDPAKSKFSAKSYTIKIVPVGDKFKYEQETIYSQDMILHRTWTAKCDGKDYPVNASDADAYSCTSVNAYTTRYVMKKYGKESWSGQSVMSKDGKTRVDSGEGNDAKGNPYSYSVFLEKQ